MVCCPVLVPAERDRLWPYFLGGLWWCRTSEAVGFPFYEFFSEGWLWGLGSSVILSVGIPQYRGNH